MSFSIAQISAIVGLLIAFGVPQANIDNVQAILSAAQAPISTTTPVTIDPPSTGGPTGGVPQTGGTIPPMEDTPVVEATPAPTCTIGGHLEFNEIGTVVGKVTWTSQNTTAGSVLIQQPSNPAHYSRVLSPIEGGTLPAGFVVSNGDIGLNLTAHISGPSGDVICTGTVPGLNWSLPMGQVGDYTLNGETRTCSLDMNGLQCKIKE